MNPIIHADGTPYFTGLIAPPAGLVGAFRPYSTSTSILSPSDIKDLVTNRVPRSQVFSDPAWIIKGNQKQHNSCAGWGGAANIGKTLFLTGSDRPVKVFSGSYIYSWCNRGVDQGAVLEEVMQELMAHGSVTADECNSEAIWRKSDAAFDAEAAKVRALDCFAISTEEELDTAIAQRLIVTVCVQVDSTKFVNFSGTGILQAFHGIGNHCVHVDDIVYYRGTKCYRLVNNWGPTWGNGGTALVTFDSFAQTIGKHQFYALSSVQDLT